jgi:hypothetical protein
MASSALVTGAAAPVVGGAMDAFDPEPTLASSDARTGEQETEPEPAAKTEPEADEREPGPEASPVPALAATAKFDRLQSSPVSPEA